MTAMDDNRVREIVAEETGPISGIGCVVLLIAAIMMGIIIVGMSRDASTQRRLTTLEQQVKELQQK